MKSISCPFLGLMDDPETHLAFPSLRNYCHRARPVDVVRLDHQSAYCLNLSYTNCPVLVNNEALPLSVELRAFSTLRNKKRLGVIIAAVLLATLLLLIGWWQRGLLAHSASPAYETAGPEMFSPSTLPLTITEITSTEIVIIEIPSIAAAIAAATPTATLPPPTLSPTSTETPLPSPTPESTLTSSPQLPPTVCTPPAGWVVYIVKPNDSLFRIGLDYGVTVAQLQAANCMGNSVMIYAGHELYVPNAPTRTPQVSPTSTSVPISPTETPVPTDTPLPTDTPPLPTDTPIPTDVPVIITDTPQPYLAASGD